MPDSKTALAFLAHPDDAEILCGGTLIRLHELGWKIHIATATAGDCGTTSLAVDHITAIRRAEARKSASLIAAEYHCLEELDGRVTYRPESIQKAIDLFRAISPSLVFTHPRVDYMLDHEQVHLLARMASFIFAAPNASGFPIPEGAHIPHLYYCDPLGGHDPYTGAPIAAGTLINVSNAHELKLQMLACHASQREWLRVHHGMDEYLESVMRTDAELGKQFGAQFAERFTQHRGHAYPQGDLLKQLFV
jgi:LmbE family N-acetylglucosaminyl deacetylase